MDKGELLEAWQQRADFYKSQANVGRVVALSSLELCNLGLEMHQSGNTYSAGILSIGAWLCIAAAYAVRNDKKNLEFAQEMITSIENE